MAEGASKLPQRSEESRRAPAETGYWSPFADLRADMDRMLDQFPLGWPTLPFGRSRGGVERFPFREGGLLQPAVEVTEDEKQYVISAELPGLKEDDVDITITEGAIAIRGEKKEEKEEKTGTVTSPSGATARSSAVSAYRKMSTGTRSRRR